MLNSSLQWGGTSALLIMYILMSFFPHLYPYNLVAGCIGGLFYFIWSIRVKNRAQIIVNAAGIIVCIAGLFKALV